MMSDKLKQVVLRCEISENALIRENAGGGFTAIMEAKGKREELTASGATAREAQDKLQELYIAWLQRLFTWVNKKGGKTK